MAGKEELATKKEIEEDTEEFLLERDNEGLYLGKEKFLLDKPEDFAESIFSGKTKRVIIIGAIVYLIILAVSGVLAYSIFKEISTALIVVGAVLGVSIVIFVIYMIINKYSKRLKNLKNIKKIKIN